MDNGDKRNIQEETELLDLDKKPQENKEALPHDNADESHAGKGKMRLWPKIVVGSLVVVIIAAIIFFIYINSASASLKIAAKNTFRAFSSSEPAALLRSVFTQGSIELILDLEDLGDQLYGPRVDGELTAKYVANQKNNQMAFILALADRGSTIADVALHKSWDAILLESDVLFGNSAYGIGLIDFADNLKNSIFNPAQGSYFALDDDTYEYLLKISSDGFFRKYSKHREMIKKIAEEALDTLYTSVIKNFEIEKDKDTIQFVDTTSKVTVLSMYGNAKVISAVIKEMLQWMENSKNLKSYMEQTADLYAPLLEESDLDPDDFVDDFYDNISQTLEDFDELADMLEEEELEVNMKFYINRKGRELVKIGCEVNSLSDSNRVEIMAGPSLRDIELISLTYTSSADWMDTNEVYSYTYTVDENDTDTYSANLRIRESTYGTTIKGRASLTWDKKDGDFRIKADDLTVKGTMLYDQDALSIYIESIADDWEDIRPGLTVTLNRKETPPDVPAFTEILKMDEYDFEDLGEEISWNIMDFINEIGTTDWLYDFLYYLF